MRVTAKSRIFGAVFAGLLALALTGVRGDAAVVIYRVEWSGVSLGNSARAVGLIGIELLEIPNPGAHLDSEPRTMPSWIVSIELTLTGENGIAGQFHKGDFEGILWDTEDATLDLSKELVGQPTHQSPWGSTNDSRSGDFNLFRVDGNLNAPNGTQFFELTAYSDTAEYPMILESFGPVPEPGCWILVSLACGGFVLLRRRS